MEGREVVSLGGICHRELSDGFFGLTLALQDVGKNEAKESQVRLSRRKMDNM